MNWKLTKMIRLRLISFFLNSFLIKRHKENYRKSVSYNLHLLLGSFYEVGQRFDDFIFGTLHWLSDKIFIMHSQSPFVFIQLFDFIFPFKNQLIEPTLIFDKPSNLVVLLLDLVVEFIVRWEFGLCGLELVENFLNALSLDIVFVPELLQKCLQL